MAKLATTARKRVPKSSFAIPSKKPVQVLTRFPTNARNALARVSQHGSPAEKAKVRAAVHRKYPGIGKSKNEQ
jgi:hypothetical protein